MNIQQLTRLGAKNLIKNSTKRSYSTSSCRNIAPKHKRQLHVTNGPVHRLCSRTFSQIRSTVRSHRTAAVLTLSSAPLIAFAGLFGRTEDGTTEDFLSTFARCLKAADPTTSENRDYFIEALEIFERLNPKDYSERYQAINRTADNMIDLYIRLNMSDQALRVYKRQLDLVLKTKLLDIDYESALRVITNYAKYCVFLEDWKTSEKLFYQKIELVKQVHKRGEVPDARILLAEAYNQAGYVEYAMGNQKEAAKMLNKGVETLQEDMDIGSASFKEMFTVSSFLHMNLGNLNKDQNNNEKALECYEIALSDISSVLADEKRVASDESYKAAVNLRIDILQQMAQIHLKEKNYDKGIQFMKDAVQHVVKAYGAKSETARDMYLSLGNMTMQLAKYDEAEALFNQALKMQQANQMKDEGKTYIKLGQLKQRAGNLIAANEYYLKALAKSAAEYGPFSIEVGAVHNNLGTVASESGDEDKAEEHYQQALAIAAKGGETLNSFRALVSGNLASIYTSKGKYAEAEKMYLDSLELRKKLYGDISNQVSTTYNNIGYLYQSQGRSDKAEEYFKKALVISEQVFDPYHPEVATVLKNLGSLKNQTDPEEAKKIYDRIMDIFVKIHGENPRVLAAAGVYRFFGTYYTSKKDYAQAEENFIKAHDILQDALSVDSPEVIKVRLLYADMLFKQGKYDRALRIFKDAREVILLKNTSELSQYLKVTDTRISKCQEQIQNEGKQK